MHTSVPFHWMLLSGSLTRPPVFVWLAGAPLPARTRRRRGPCRRGCAATWPCRGWPDLRCSAVLPQRGQHLLVLVVMAAGQLSASLVVVAGRFEMLFRLSPEVLHVSVPGDPAGLAHWRAVALVALDGCVCSAIVVNRIRVGARHASRRTKTGLWR